MTVNVFKRKGIYRGFEIHNRRRKSLTSHKDLQQELENAVQTLLKPPHVFYVKELHSATQEDAYYIFNNETIVGSNVQKILVNEGVHWKPDVMKLEWPRVLAMAFHRMEEK